MNGQATGNHLAENPIERYQPMTDLFPNESIMSIEPNEGHSNWQMYLDGAVNIHGNQIGLF